MILLIKVLINCQKFGGVNSRMMTDRGIYGIPSLNNGTTGRGIYGTPSLNNGTSSRGIILHKYIY